MYASSSVTGLVVDCGFSSSQVLPIFEGYPIIQAFQSSPAGGALLHKYLADIVGSQSVVPSFDILEDIVTRAMFLPYGELAQEIERETEQVNAKTYSIRPETSPRAITIAFRDRIAPAQVLFGTLESDSPNIAASLLKALQKSDIDLRSKLASNIIVSGGIAMLPGFIQRFYEEIIKLLDSDEFASLKPLSANFRIVETPFPRNLLSWIGGSILGCLSSAERFAESQEDYKNKGVTDPFGTQYLLPSS
mmetsp:Transcript_30042/g.53274  ORF Transcript_30042/g.53274 Transcript_30042/m.53274 type:complete len:248 (+) Transcript_30042:351-1094(+)